MQLNESTDAPPYESELGTARQERRISDLIVDLAPMREATDLKDLFAGLARSVVGTLRADACLVSVYDEEERVLRDVGASVVSPAKLNVVAEEYAVDDFPMTAKILAEKSHVELSLSDPKTDDSERKILRRFGFSRVLLSAFSMGDDVVGTIETYRINDRSFRRDDPEHIELLTEFAATNHSRLQLANRLEEHYTKTIEALTSALEARDPYTEAHTSRIRDIAMALSIAMRIPQEERRAVQLGALLHDVGKIGISDSILRKEGPLTEDEWAVMRKHPEIGERMLSGIDFLAPALPTIRHHHERWDGTGYPDGLKGTEIPLGARIVAVCDAFDAMTSDRPYRKAMSVTEAENELVSGAGTQWDPLCALLLVEMLTSVGLENLEERFVRYAN